MIYGLLPPTAPTFPPRRLLSLLLFFRFLIICKVFQPCKQPENLMYPYICRGQTLTHTFELIFFKNMKWPFGRWPKGLSPGAIALFFFFVQSFLKDDRWLLDRCKRGSFLPHIEFLSIFATGPAISGILERDRDREGVGCWTLRVFGQSLSQLLWRLKKELKGFN